MTILNKTLITITGATASSKTSLAAHLAKDLEGEILSADSRQVYRRMNLGTGKDYKDYMVDGVKIPVHLIDLVDAGYKYNVYEFQRDFRSAYDDIMNRGKQAILCGGTGMYIDAVLNGYKLINVPVNNDLRSELEQKEMDELIALLESKKKLHNVSDTSTRKRLIRALEIAEFYEEHPNEDISFPKIDSVIFGVKFDRQSRRKRITGRLKERLKEGMVEEVECLLKSGITAEQLIFYGLEYKYLTQYVTGDIYYNDMFQRLNTAIHQFAKRQMTWFRRMEKQGTKIHWLDGYMPMEEKLEKIKSVLQC
jgi:tRNA dimethylallyltransferase